MVGALLDPGHSCTRVALDMIASGQADVGPMITHHFPFEKVQEAYDLQNTLNEGAVKIIVENAEVMTMFDAVTTETLTKAKDHFDHLGYCIVDDVL